MSERLFGQVFERLAQRWPLPTADAFPVAWRGGQAITRADFHRDLTQAACALAALGQPRIVLFDSDVYDFAVWLFAAWALGLRVILPGDDLPATRAALTAAPWVGRRQGTTQNAVEHWSGQGEAALEVLPDFGEPGLLLFTSGSSGEPSLIDKLLPQMRPEIEGFQQTFGDRLVPGTRFVLSVPHQHMFGLPFGLLWSLTFAYPVVAERLRYAEEFWRLPEADYLLVSAPTFLRQLPELAAAGFTAERGARWRMGVSAGSPLPATVQKKCSDLMGAPLFEIYGSTETGSVARREEHGIPWKAMPRVRLCVDPDTSRLRIFSPLLAPEELEEGHLAKDLASIGPRGFELIGRVDRIVKIGEKRVSLGKVEKAVASLPEVVRAVVLPLSSEAGRREILGAVVILSDAGRESLVKLGKTLFDRTLRKALHDQLESIVLPRRWRYVEALPGNDLGKTTQRDLERLFAPQLPQAVCLLQEQDEKGGGRVQLQLQIPADLVWFEGHFPQLPVLPGVVQVDWAAHFGQLHFADLGCDGPVTSVTGLKFMRVIQPGEQLRLELRWLPGKAQLEFAYRNEEGDVACSCGVLVFRKTPSPA
jgi:acyl-coenzyme A synthetase/AMP-(fatty) acid ligase/3-hydroxymyristoyl/3-hydroxydecanoyl-(acyl carrier protein) dehydratase